MLRVNDLDVMRRLDIGCSHRAGAILAQAQGHFITVVQLEHHTLEVQQNVDDIFLDTVNGRVLMEHTGNSDFRGGMPDHRRQQNAPQRVTQRVTVATLEGFERHFCAVGAQLLNVNGFWFQ